MIQGIASRFGIHGLFTFHCTLHDGMMRLERLDVVGITLEDFFFDSLAQAIFTNRLDNFGTMMLLGINPLCILASQFKKKKKKRWTCVSCCCCV
jgi:hypothetical protein